MSRQRPFLARLLNRQSTAAARPYTNRTVRRLQQNFEALENRQLLTTMAGLEMAPAEVTDQQQIVVDTSSQSLAERDVHQASDQQASAVIPETLADDLAPAVDINKVNLNTNHLDQLLTSPEIEQNLDHLIRGLEMQLDFSSMDGLAEEIQSGIDQFDDFVESQILWQDPPGQWLDAGDGRRLYVVMEGEARSEFETDCPFGENNWSCAGSWDDEDGTWTNQTDDNGGRLLYFLRERDGDVSYLQSETGEDESNTGENQSDNQEEGWFSEAWGWVFDDNDDDDDDNDSDDDDDSWATDVIEWMTGEDDDSDDSDECFPKPWWEDYGFNSISDIAGTDLWMSNPLQTQDVAEFFLNQADGQFLQAMDMIHTQNMWQM